MEKKQKKLGLALGSGSALGFAHIGVLQVLAEEKIPIHCIAGSSMGAVIGGVYSAGTDLDMLCRVIPELDEQNYFDIAMPRKGGFLLGKRFQDLIALFTKRYTFSQAKFPFACVAVELHSGEVVTLQDPDLALDEAIRASMSIPMVFRPHSLDEQTLVDGGLLVRVPGMATKALGADIVVGVDVGYRGWHRDIVPEQMFSYALFVSDIALWEIQRRREMAGEYDLMIVPDVHGIDANSFSDFEAAVLAGREAITAQLPALREILFS